MANSLGTSQILLLSSLIKPYMLSNEPSNPTKNLQISPDLSKLLLEIMSGDLNDEIVSFDPGFMDIAIEYNLYSKIKIWIGIIVASVVLTSLLSQPWFTGNLFLFSAPVDPLNDFLGFILYFSFLAILISSIAIFLHYLHFQLIKRKAKHTAYINLDYENNASDPFLENSFAILFNLFNELGFRFQLFDNKLVSFSPFQTITIEYTVTDIIIGPVKRFNSTNQINSSSFVSKAILIEFTGKKEVIYQYWNYASDVLQRAFNESHQIYSQNNKMAIDQW